MRSGRRVALASLGLALLVVLATLASARLEQRGHAARLERRVKAAATAVSALHASEARSRRLLLAALCARDLQVERLARTLAAGSVDPRDAEREALGIARALGGDVWLLVGRDGALARMGEQPKGALPSEQALAEAERSPQLLAGDEARVVTTCVRRAPGIRLWLVHSEPLVTLTRRLLAIVPDVGVRPAHDARAGDEHADALALRIAGADGAPGFALWLRTEDAPSIDALLGYLPLAAVLALFAGLLASFAARRRLDESVLVALEQAAERVGRGDLETQAGRRPGERADQTLRTFDRMTAELKEMRARLTEAERIAAWRDIARRIAHEIKNPLSPIQLAIETLRKAHAKRLPAFDEIFEESTRAVLEEVRRMERIVREFSEFARLPAARPGELSLAALVEETVELYRPADVDVTVFGADDELSVRGDREQLTQVIVNLMQNACDAARAKSNPKIELRLSRAEGDVLLHVDDSGPGVTREDRARVFEPYYTTKVHGTGLGLAIVRRIAVEHGGAVEVSESPLGGARFTLKLPGPHDVLGQRS